jgi:hypothetical protein
MLVVGVANVMVVSGLQYCSRTEVTLAWSSVADSPQLLSMSLLMEASTSFRMAVLEQTQDCRPVSSSPHSELLVL